MPRPTNLSWRDRVTAEVAAKVGNKKRSRYVSRLNIEIPPGGLLELLTEAAARRDCSPTTYIRRAMMAFIAYDMHIPYAKIVRMDPRFTEPHGNNAIVDEAGELGGPWEIT